MRTPRLVPAAAAFTALVCGGCGNRHVDDVSPLGHGSLSTVRQALDGGPVDGGVGGTPLVWTPEGTLSPTDDPANINFGDAVALSGNTAIVGVPLDGVNGMYSGSAYVFVRNGTTWTQQQKLLPSDGFEQDTFGAYVALDGDTAVVGSVEDDDKGLNSGSAYVFVRNGTTWTQQQKLVASDGQAGDQLGFGVVVQGNTAIIGAIGDDDGADSSGASYVFERNGTVWTEGPKLKASVPTVSAAFGYSQAIDGDTLVIGAARDQGVALYTGSVYVFVRNGGSWTEQQRLTVNDGAIDDYFGGSVAVSGDTALIGAFWDDDAGNNSGSAYVFVRSNNVWSQQQKLGASNGQAGHEFGHSVAVLGDTAVVLSSSVYAFTRSSGSWTEQQISTGASHTACEISLRENFALIGAVGDSALTFRLGATDGSACSSDSECNSDHCVENVCCDEACDGVCESCLASRKISGLDGACGTVLAGTDPRNSCAVEAPSTCGTTGACNGSGQCSLHPVGTQCASASCTTSTSENPIDTCNGAGTCSATTPVACGTGYVCTAATCRTDCNTDGDCDVSRAFECVAGECKIPLGEACTGHGECLSTHCIDDICLECVDDDDCAMDSYCASGSCAADEELGQSCGEDDHCESDHCVVGSCEECAADEHCPAVDYCDEAVCNADEPNGEPCVEDDHCQSNYCFDDACADCSQDAQCATEEYCNAGVCSADEANGEPCSDDGHCASSLCVNDICQACATDDQCTPEQYCDSAACVPDAANGATCTNDGHCESGHCQNGTCGACSGDQHCATNLFCDDGACAADLPNGEECEAAAQCQSNNCISGTCRACNADSQCATEQYCAEGVCVADDANGVACTDAGHCASGICTEGVCCDAECLEGCEACTVSLKGYGTDGVCEPVQRGLDPRNECQEVEDCVSAPFCNGHGVCACTRALCGEDGASVITANETESCGLYRCIADPEGECLTECESSADCVSGARCNSQGECVASASTADGAETNAGCSCEMVGRQSSPLWWLPALGLLSTVALRRRKSHRGKEAF